MNWIERSHLKHGPEYKKMIDRLPPHLVDPKYMAKNERPTKDETVDHFRERQDLKTQEQWTKWIENDLTVLRGQAEFIDTIKDQPQWADVLKEHDKFLLRKSKELESNKKDNPSSAIATTNPGLSAPQNPPSDVKTDQKSVNMPVGSTIVPNSTPVSSAIPNPAANVSSEHYKRKDETWSEMLREESEELYNLTHQNIFNEHTLLEYIDVMFIFKFIPKELLKSAFNLHLEKCKRKNYDTKLQEEWGKIFLG